MPRKKAKPETGADETEMEATQADARSEVQDSAEVERKPGSAEIEQDETAPSAASPAAMKADVEDERTSADGGPAEVEDEGTESGAAAAEGAETYGDEGDSSPVGAEEEGTEAAAAADTAETGSGEGDSGPAGVEGEGAAEGTVAAATAGIGTDEDDSSPVEAAAPTAVENGSQPEGQAPEGMIAGAPLVAGEDGAAESEAGPTTEDEGLVSSGAGLSLEEKKRRRLFAALALLVVLLLSVSLLFYRYLKQPAPLPELLPLQVGINYAPHYLFSIYGLDKPVGVALSPQGDRIYVTETGGERLVKVFNREGELLGFFAPPRTQAGDRSPVYLAVDSSGRVLVTDRLQHVVFAYDSEGNYLDTLLSPDLTLSEYVSTHIAGFEPGDAMAYNLFEQVVYYRPNGKSEQMLAPPSPMAWSPLGVRVDRWGNLLLTDVFGDRHAIRQIPGDALAAYSWQDFEPAQIVFGSSGGGGSELSFPNAAVVDSLDRVYVTDGNNGCVSVWDRSGELLFSFGQGAGDAALSLPRGAAMDARDRLHVVDAVQQSVKVYDVSGADAEFLFAFGDWGAGDGQFDYPNDIALDTTGRLYIADRENDRIQVWSY